MRLSRCLECETLVLVKAFMPSRLNGKQEAAPQTPPKLRCPRNGTVDEAGSRSSQASIPAHTPLRAHAFGKVAGVASPARIPASEGASPRASLMSHAPAGKRFACRCRGPSVMFHLLRNAPHAPKAPRRSFLFVILLSC